LGLGLGTDRSPGSRSCDRWRRSESLLLDFGQIRQFQRRHLGTEACHKSPPKARARFSFRML
jgi:hypothetical protein